MKKFFHIHPSHEDRSLHLFPLSKRARNVLQSVGVETLHGLDGLSHRKILESKNCGFKTYGEIARFEKKFAPFSTASAPKENISSSSSQPPLISIPMDAHRWNMDHLPFSIRLRHVLGRLNCRTLGELHNLSYDVLAETPDCGKRTLDEFRHFLKRVRKKEYGVPREQTGKSHAAFLVSHMDAFVATLPQRPRAILLDRVGGQMDPMTLKSVGLKYKMTRERVRQIIDQLTGQLLRLGGPPFAQCLQEFTNELNQKLWPLTPALLDQLIGPPPNRPLYLLPFYIRWLSWLSPTLSAWPVGQTPAAYRIPPQQRIIVQLKKWFQGRAAPAGVVEAHRGITGEGLRCAPFEFLEALRFAAEFAINMENPRNPLICPPVETPYRWARQVLSESEKSTLPPEILARARALLSLRRSHGARYRLACIRKT